MSTADISPVPAIFCADEHPVSGALCRNLRDDCTGDHDPDGLPDWAAAPSETPKD